MQIHCVVAQQAPGAETAGKGDGKDRGGVGASLEAGPVVSGGVCVWVEAE